MGSSQNVELEAAKFLHKLIQDSKDEPAKLATKLYVVCSFFSQMEFYSCSFTPHIQLSMFVINFMYILDIATYEIKREGTFNAISSDIKVSICNIAV